MTFARSIRSLAPAAALVTTAALLTACGSGNEPQPAADGAPAAAADAPQFSLAWSEYPSWSVFGVADLYGLIDGDAGKLGPIEQKHNVDLVLNETDYDTCLTLYATGEVDAVCITNMDILNPATSRPSVAILPTSTSNGADALIVTGVDSIEDLKSTPAYGLEASVSQYAFVRGLEVNGFDPAEFTFTNMDPAAAAQAMITRQDGFDAIVVWNPFVLETLKQRSDAKVLFDSSAIPGEIVDMVVVADESLAREGGDRAARAIAEAFYAVCRKLEDSAEGDEALVALGSKFSSLGFEQMQVVVEQTDFYETPELAAELFTGAELPETMKTVVAFCQTYGIITDAPTIGYGDGAAQLRFTAEYVTEPAADQPGG
ncbi:MAG: hypothetical protein AAF078_05025 [Planctomycetota bacterium]